MRNTTILLTAFLVPALPVSAETYNVTSPDGKAVVELDLTENSLSYSVSWDGKELLESAPISFVDEPKYEVLGKEEKTLDSTWQPTWGPFNEVRDHCQQLKVELKVSGVRADLLCQVYNDGVGMRFVVPDQKGLKGKPFNFSIDYDMAGDYSMYFGNPSSNPPIGPIRSKAVGKSKVIKGAPPLVINLTSGAWMAMLDSDLFTAELFKSGNFTSKPKSDVMSSSSPAKAKDQGFVTPWKVIVFSEQPGDLMLNMVALNLAAPCQIEDTSWIKTGTGLWDWRIHGYDNGDFKYGIDTRSYMRQIDFASKNGLEYLTVDDHWFLKAKDGTMEVSPEVDIEKVVKYGEEKGVKIMLYYDAKKGSYGDDKIFKYYASLGVVGMKYGFRGNNAPFTRMAIKEAAENKLMVFFHDGPMPMAGVERTMPNMISREYGHGQQDSRRAFTPETFLKMAMINSLTGPLDLSNGNFGIKSINAGEREKGPRVKNSYIATVVSEAARCLIIPTGLVTLPDAPEEYEKKADLFEFLKEMPATWDDSLVPNSKMAEYITVARRSGETWFVASVSNEEAREIEISLDFLDPDVEYEATLFEDTPETHAVSSPEQYQVSKKTFTSKDTVTAGMAEGGGHAMILKKKN
ncbi:MAG: glycoside hydrolase family 97 catalytic domain-containing protein [Luteolibacter sp.]